MNINIWYIGSFQFGNLFNYDFLKEQGLVFLTLNIIWNITKRWVFNSQVFTIKNFNT